MNNSFHYLLNSLHPSIKTSNTLGNMPKDSAKFIKADRLYYLRRTDSFVRKTAVIKYESKSLIETSKLHRKFLSDNRPLVTYGT